MQNAASFFFPWPEKCVFTFHVIGRYGPSDHLCVQHHTGFASNDLARLNTIKQTNCSAAGQNCILLHR